MATGATWGIVPAARSRDAAECLVEQMTRAGADHICLVVPPAKSDTVDRLARTGCSAELSVVVEARPAGFCDAIFRAAPLVGDIDCVIVGLPSAAEFAVDPLVALGTDSAGVQLVPVELPGLGARWVWGAFKMSGRAFHELHALWLERGNGDECVGSLLGAWLAEHGVLSSPGAVASSGH